MARTKRAYSEEQCKWVLKNKNKYISYESITHDFNAKFGTDKSVCAIQQLLTKRLNIRLATKRNASHYTKAEEDWLMENYDKHETYEELTTELNKHFGNNRVSTSVREKCTKRLGLKGMENPTVYKKGNVKEQCPIGTIRKSSNGSTYIKVQDSACSYQSGYREPYWLPIQKKIWIDHYGEVPEGKMVMFLDGNRDNLDISNLYCIDRKISAVMASNGWYSENGELTLTAIKWCELFYTLKG
jgi:hypothetical protein